MDGIAKLYQYEPSKLRELELQRVKATDSARLKSDKSLPALESETALDILLHRCEALFFHGYVRQACVLAECLAEQMLATRSSVQSLFHRRDSKQSHVEAGQNVSQATPAHKLTRQKCLSSFYNTVLWRSFFLCNILNECAVQLNLADPFNQSLKLKVTYWQRSSVLQFLCCPYAS